MVLFQLITFALLHSACFQYNWVLSMSPLQRIEAGYNPALLVHSELIRCNVPVCL
jgi:hypothetical protein